MATHRPNPRTQAGGIPTPPKEVPLPRSLQALLTHVPPTERHPALQLDKYSRAGDQAQKEALAEVVRVPGSPALFQEVWQRREATLRGLGAEGWCRTTGTPLTLHLARASAMENAGICLHPVYGFAYLPGTGLKGMARAYAETVWLAACPEAEKVDAWRDIESVFGWTPESQILGKGVTKPWKPVGVSEHGPNERSASGRIGFYEAWPTAWPRLTVDIINNHHSRYYQGEDAPGDWEAPIPVYFLTIPPGQEFSFALGNRRGDDNGRLLQLARTWLDGALTLMGCGAKTNAGYGYFKGDGPLPSAPGRLTCEARLELTAPAFLAGANQFGQEADRDCDLRSATLRGLLRWWWRTLHAGYLDRQQLRTLEAALWGDTAAGGAVQLALFRHKRVGPVLFDFKNRFEPRADFKQQHQLADRPNGKTTQGLFYVSYGMDEPSRDQRRQRHVLEAGSSWILRMTARSTPFATDREDAAKPDRRHREHVITADQALDQAHGALFLLCTFGAAGSKSRKGFGSLRECSDALTSTTLPSVQETAQRLRGHLGLPNTFSAAGAESPSLRQALFLEPEVTTPWSDPWKVLDEVGFAYQSFAQQHRHDERKSALGLPRKIHGPRDDRPMDNQNAATWRPAEFLDFPRRDNRTPIKDARHASPVQIHLARAASSQLIVRAAAFPSSCLPDLENSRRFLQEFLTFFGDVLKQRIDAAPAARPMVPAQPAISRGPEKRPSNTPVLVKMLGPRPKGGYHVQEDGKPEGTLTLGPVPKELPPEGEQFEVLIHVDDARCPQYKWKDPNAPSPRLGPVRRTSSPQGGRPRR